MLICFYSRKYAHPLFEESLKFITHGRIYRRLWQLYILGSHVPSINKCTEASLTFLAAEVTKKKCTAFKSSVILDLQTDQESLEAHHRRLHQLHHPDHRHHSVRPVLMYLYFRVDQVGRFDQLHPGGRFNKQL